MRKRRFRQSGRPRRRGGAVLIVIIACVAVLVLWIDAAARPVIESMAAYQAKVFATRIINNAMLAQMESAGINYSELVKITRGNDQEVMSIETDMAAMNRLKTHMSDAVIAQLGKNENRKISVPLGTIIGNQFTSGRGPLVEIKILPVGYVQSEIYNEFTSAGINQTLHQIMLRVTVQIAAILPGYHVKTDTVTNFCLTETVIVGKIPQGFAVVGNTATYRALEE